MGQAFYGATGPWERMNLLLSWRERKGKFLNQERADPSAQ